MYNLAASDIDTDVLCKAKPERPNHSDTNAVKFTSEKMCAQGSNSGKFVQFL
jgi:hypothetical protein